MSRNKLFSGVILLMVFTVGMFAQTLPPGVEKVVSVEGVTEYAYPNGLHVLLFPDNSNPKLTVNVVYRVGSRNEGYGETGMAHLLEHMCFKSTTNGRTLFPELTNHAGGGNFNGTTDYDRTMYFETVSASDENLRWALSLEADRMVKMTMKGEDLVTEMPVVRNEMEMGENDPESVLEERVLAAAYNFHNYGKTVIGNRTDVERVPIASLATFYKKYYQPDNADLIVAGQFDEHKALAMIAEIFGAIPKPDRVLAQPYTAEPTQEGEREVILRRIGSEQFLMTAYHIPAALHPDAAPIRVLAEILGAQQTGRLYKALVDTRKATSSYFYARSLHDPGFASAVVELKTDQPIDEARQTLLSVVEGFNSTPPSQEEVDRAKARLLKNIELAMTSSQGVAMMVASDAGAGDWRLRFLLRDEIAKVTPADVARVASAYLLPSNRTLGEFIPTPKPERAEIPETPGAAARFKDYKGGAGIQQGEVFDPTPENIEARVTRTTLPNGMKLVLFPKKTRGGVVSVALAVRFGDEKSVFGRSIAADLAGSLLMRGTKTKNRQQIQDETDRLKAQIHVWGGDSSAGAGIKTVAENLPSSMRLLRELLRESTLPDSEFEEARLRMIEEAESQKTSPEALARIALDRHLNAQYKRGDPRYVETLDEQLEDLKAVKPEEAREFYRKFYGAGEGEIAISGQFDPAAITKLAGELFGDWKSTVPYARIKRMYAPVEPVNQKIETADKANAIFLAGAPMRFNDGDPDYPAMAIAEIIFGGSANSRIFQRIRVKDGLSYGADAYFSMPAYVAHEDGGELSVFAIAAPQNVPKVEADFQEELARALKDGFTADEVEKAKKIWADREANSRANEDSLARILQHDQMWGRTLLSWDAKRDAAIAAVTAQQVSDAFKKHVGDLTLSIVKGGDFKKANVYQ